MKNMNKKYRKVLDDYDIESVEIHNYDLFAKLKDKIKKEKSNSIEKEKENQMTRKSKTDTILEVVLNLKEEFNEFKTEVKSEIQEIKNDLNNFKIEVREEFSKVNSRLDKLDNDVHILKQDMNAFKSEAIKHGWNIN